MYICFDRGKSEKAFVFNFDQIFSKNWSFLNKTGKNNFSDFIHLNIPNISEDNQMYTSV